MSKEIYFVRHGLTVANESRTIQGFDDALTEKGLAQAERLAERLSRVKFDTMLASDMHRARQTAEVVAERTHHEPMFSPLFREIQYPSSLVDLSRDDPRVAEFWHQQEENQHNPDWKFEDEESVAEIIARIRNAFAFAAEQGSESVAVITHGNFLRKLLLILLLGDDDATRHWKERQPLIVTSNTGITLFRHVEHDGHGAWRLITWNDHAHLG